MTVSTRLNIPPNRTRTAHVYVRDALRDSILNGTLPAGTRLIQSHLATQLSVSNTPVREALRDLAGEGLVVFDPHRGSRVRGLDINEVRELYEMRIALEPLMVQRVIRRITATQLDCAQDICDQLAHTDEPTNWSELNRQFHSIFTLDEQQSRLASVIGGLRGSASMYVALSLGVNADRLKESNDEHKKLIECYRAGDSVGATTMTVQHLRATLAALERANQASAM